ncbi:MAG: universal stress protein, partial [Pseudomonadota bacterium]
MSTYDNILVAIDGSDESDKILDRALQLADDNGAQVNVVLVFEPLLGNYSFELNMADFEKVQQEHQEQVAKQVRESLSNRSP